MTVRQAPLANGMCAQPGAAPARPRRQCTRAKVTPAGAGARDQPCASRRAPGASTGTGPHRSHPAKDDWTAGGQTDCQAGSGTHGLAPRKAPGNREKAGRTTGTPHGCRAAKASDSGGRRQRRPPFCFGIFGGTGGNADPHFVSAFLGGPAATPTPILFRHFAGAVMRSSGQRRAGQPVTPARSQGAKALYGSAMSETHRTT